MRDEGEVVRDEGGKVSDEEGEEMEQCWGMMEDG